MGATEDEIRPPKGGRYEDKGNGNGPALKRTIKDDAFTGALKRSSPA